jgi:polar amino acid transport system substrate-binding protein
MNTFRPAAPNAAWPRLRRLFCTVLLGIVGLMPAHAAEPGCQPLRVGMSTLGVAYFRQDGQPRGVDVDLMREVGRRLGCGFEIVEMNRARIYQSLERGEIIDLATAASRTPERDQYAEFVPIGKTRDYLLVHKRLAKPGFDLNQFVATPELRMGALAKSNYSSFINARLAVLSLQGRVEVTVLAESLIPRLIAGRYDGLIVTPAYFIAALNELPGGVDLRALPIPEGEPYQWGVYMSRRTLDEGRRQRIREALESIRRDGTLLKIHRQYYPEELARENGNF